MSDDAGFWNKIAARYAAQAVANPEAFDRKTERTRALLRPDSVVLEVGCGTGSLALRLAPSVGQYHGLDFSREMVRIANEKKAAQGVDNVSFHEGSFDASFALFGPGTLDGVCMFSVLHLLADREAALARAFELSRPGGFFVASTTCLAESKLPFGAIIAVMRWFGRAPAVVSSFSKATLREEIARAGYVDIEEPDVGAERTISFVVARKPS